MRVPLLLRAACAASAGVLFLCLSLARTPAVAHMAPPFFGPPAHAALGRGHFALRGFRDLSRLGANRMGPDRFGFNRFSNDHFGFNRFGFNRFGFNANALSFGLLDDFGSWGYPQLFPATPAAPIVAVSPT